MPPKRKSSNDAVVVEEPLSKRSLEDDQAEGSNVIKTLARMVYGRKTNKAYMKAVEYILSTSKDKSDPDIKAFVAYIRGVYPAVNPINLSNAWIKLHQFFTGDLSQQEQYQRLARLLDAPRMIEAFCRLPDILDNVDEETGNGDSEGSYEGSAKEVSTPSQDIHSSVTSSSTPKRRRSTTKSASSGKSRNSNASLSSSALFNLRRAYEENWQAYTGRTWVLPSGITLDEIVRHYVLGLTYESALHSCVISDLSDILQLPQNQQDKQALRIAIGQPRDNTAWTLPDVEKQYLQFYDVAPHLMEEKMWYGGEDVWKTAAERVAADKEKKERGEDVVTAVMPDKSFCRLIHELINSLFVVYERNKLTIPDSKSESWYRENPWALLHILLNVKDTLSYEPGEYYSRASSYRKNTRRKTAQEKQQLGRKSDGIIACVSPTLELGAAEVVKADPTGLQSTKILKDRLKLAKTLKDQIDRIREMLATDKEEAAKQLATYGLLIVGGSISFYTLRLQTGRFYQFTCQGTATLPSNWMSNGDNTTSILTAVANLLLFRRQVVDMAINIRRWTKRNYELAEPAGALRTDIPVTITTPTSSPSLSPSAAPESPATLPPL
ncbi:hypothetical protein BGW38_001809 [Lunasporangiospora selenospora]|uniref:Uncharacterized protein n=1 Tax=Lunasporangiospora selenospora TaxID=979761 RepID=A0A9P6FTS4_9FUNG|nr:hypothetical protein BGW38_001809 [Lunasporangiospora selenospora]